MFERDKAWRGHEGGGTKAGGSQVRGEVCKVDGNGEWRETMEWSTTRGQ